MTAQAVALGERLASIYRGIAERSMRGVAICNPGLEVQAVGFRPHAGHAIGVLVTPWFMNIVLAAVEGGPALPAARLGDVRAVSVPAGRIEVTVGELEDFGRLDAASLFSPMFGFADPAATYQTAAAAMAALFMPGGHDASPPAARDRRSLLFGRGSCAP